MIKHMQVNTHYLKTFIESRIARYSTSKSLQILVFADPADVVAGQCLPGQQKQVSHALIK